MPKPTILTYIDAGTCDVTHVMRAIAREVRPAAYELRAVMADDLRHDAALFDDAVLLVMPGGADLPFCEALNGAPNHRIRRFVHEGGVYLGICAGAYYACRELAFHAGNADAICGPRELGFVDALAVGSLPQLTGASLTTQRRGALRPPKSARPNTCPQPLSRSSRTITVAAASTSAAEQATQRKSLPSTRALREIPPPS